MANRPETAPDMSRSEPEKKYHDDFEERLQRILEDERVVLERLA